MDTYETWYWIHVTRVLDARYISHMWYVILDTCDTLYLSYVTPHTIYRLHVILDTGCTLAYHIEHWIQDITSYWTLDRRDYHICNIILGSISTNSYRHLDLFWEGFPQSFQYAFHVMKGRIYLQMSFLFWIFWLRSIRRLKYDRSDGDDKLWSEISPCLEISNKLDFMLKFRTRMIYWSIYRSLLLSQFSNFRWVGNM